VTKKRLWREKRSKFEMIKYQTSSCKHTQGHTPRTFNISKETHYLSHYEPRTSITQDLYYPNLLSNILSVLLTTGRATLVNVEIVLQAKVLRVVKEPNSVMMVFSSFSKLFCSISTVCSRANLTRISLEGDSNVTRMARIQNGCWHQRVQFELSNLGL